MRYLSQLMGVGLDTVHGDPVLLPVLLATRKELEHVQILCRPMVEQTVWAVLQIHRHAMKDHVRVSVPVISVENKGYDTKA